MAGRIYLLTENSQLVAMEETFYESEQLLQKLLANHSDLLAGEQINSDEPRRWILVTREMTVPGDEDSTVRWSLDHLFIDQDGVPTLVEVKRSTNSEVRRKVVGQMLDYAANAVVYWPVEEIKAKFESRCQESDEDPEEILAALLTKDQSADDFWLRVRTNLQAGRIRLVFIADSIPTELRRVVEFLNEQMDPAEVLAIEVKQFVGSKMKTLVPRVLGQTETARLKKSSKGNSGKEWDEESFMNAVRERKGDEQQKVANDLLNWLRPQVTSLWWGRGLKEGGVVPIVQGGAKEFCFGRMATQGWFTFRFDWLYKKPPFNDESSRRELLAKINDIPGVTVDDDALKRRARINFDKLTNPAAMDKLKVAIGWLIAQLKNECEKDA